MGTWWKLKLYKSPFAILYYIILLVEEMQVKAVEFHRIHPIIGDLWIFSTSVSGSTAQGLGWGTIASGFTDWPAGIGSTANTIHSSNAGLMLVQRRRRWINIEPTLVQRHVRCVGCITQLVAARWRHLMASWCPHHGSCGGHLVTLLPPWPLYTCMEVTLPYLTHLTYST